MFWRSHSPIHWHVKAPLRDCLAFTYLFFCKKRGVCVCGWVCCKAQKKSVVASLRMCFNVLSCVRVALKFVLKKNPPTLLILWWSFTKDKHKLVHKHTSKHRYIVFSILLWFPCILGNLAARLHAQSDQLFKLPWALWVFPGFIRSSCWKFGTMKNMMHGERDKYHRDSSAMCHLMQSREREKCNIRFSKRRRGWCLCFSENSMLMV